MRRVIYKIYRPKTDDTPADYVEQPEPAYFHGFSTQSEQSNAGSFGNDPIAILETVSGDIIYQYPPHMRFIDEPTPPTVELVQGEAIFAPRPWWHIALLSFIGALLGSVVMDCIKHIV